MQPEAWDRPPATRSVTALAAPWTASNAQRMRVGVIGWVSPDSAATSLYQGPTTHVPHMSHHTCPTTHVHTCTTIHVPHQAKVDTAVQHTNKTTYVSHRFPRCTNAHVQGGGEGGVDGRQQQVRQYGWSELVSIARRGWKGWQRDTRQHQHEANQHGNTCRNHRTSLESEPEKHRTAIGVTQHGTNRKGPLPVWAGA